MLKKVVARAKLGQWILCVSLKLGILAGTIRFVQQTWLQLSSYQSVKLFNLFGRLRPRHVADQNE